MRTPPAKLRRLSTEDRHPVAAANHADDHDRDQQTGEREHEVDEPLDDHVGRPSHVAGEDPERAGEDDACEGDHKGARDRRVRAGDDAREYVATELVGSEEVLRRRGGAGVQEILRGRVVGLDPVSE